MNNISQGDKAARNAGRARAAVGLQDVAVNRDGVFAQCCKIDDGPQTASNESLDFGRASIDFASITLFAGCRAAGEHIVFRSDPTQWYISLFPDLSPRWQRAFQTGRTQHHGIAGFDQHACRRCLHKAALDSNGA